MIPLASQTGIALLKIVSGEKPREIALAILSQRAGVQFIEELLERTLAGAGLSGADRGLCQELVYGVVRWQATLDWLIGRKTANRVQKPALQDLLRIGLYQIFWLSRVPDHAAVHVTVELAKRRGFGPQAGFVNALLRGYLRESQQTRDLLLELKSTRPALGFSHPEWLVQLWTQRWGEGETRQLLEWNNTPPRTFARLNGLKAEPGKLLEQWRNEGVEYDFVRREWLEENLMFELKSHPPLETLPSFQQGLFYIQDPSTLLAVRELDPRSGETILDLCAAPGGKLTYIAQKMNNEGRLVGCDLNPQRFKLIEQNCTRLGVTCVQTALASALSRNEEFDRVLVDAPCSNTGVMRRRVDLRWRIRPEEIQRLCTSQLELLALASAAVKTNGVLVYSTCSLEPEENERVVEVFLKQHTKFTADGQRQLKPAIDGVDGAFVARLIRR